MILLRHWTCFVIQPLHQILTPREAVLHAYFCMSKLSGHDAGREPRSLDVIVLMTASARTIDWFSYMEEGRRAALYLAPAEFF